MLISFENNLMVDFYNWQVINVTDDSCLNLLDG